MGFTPKEITIIPGLSYGHLEFESPEEGARLMADMDAENVKILQQKGKERHIALFPTTLGLKDLKNKASLDFPISEPAITGRIPGLYIVDEFITKQEEESIVKALDERSWIKMLQRRVQHFGYEFVYGANNVDKSRKISDMPDFLSFLLPKINNYLKSFTFNETNEAKFKEYTE